MLLISLRESVTKRNKDHPRTQLVWICDELEKGKWKARAKTTMFRLRFKK